MTKHIDWWDGRSNLPILHETVRQSAPGYPYRHSGSVVICGFGETLFDDLARVAKIKPDLPTIGVNKVSAYVKCFAIYSFHYDQAHLGIWVEWQKKKFGDGFTVHAPGNKEFLPHNQRNYPYVDYFWHASASRGSSAWCAVRMAKMMGFEEIILCGVPMQRLPYANKQPAWYFQSGRTNALDQFKKAIAEDTAHHPGVCSMSGWTREILGAPAWA